ncbi:MAG TPA: 2-dehydro-3-deoxygalactonokinase [Rhizomicrobium sp.]
MAAAFIAGDWGTSHLRLSLCDARGRALESTQGPGVGPAKGRVEEVFFEQIAAWDAHGKLPVMFCGMVGSTIGWREVPYLSCPLGPENIAHGLLRFQARGRTIALAPGLSCRNRLQAPDYMRGEETQILGATKLEPSLMQGRHVLCMPGTHTKWVSLKDGVIEHFLTAVSGELYDILYHHSVLVNNRDGQDIAGGRAFERALEQTKMFPDGELIHLLFENRSRQLQGELKAADAGAYLSGLIIGQDVSGARRFFRSDLAEAKGAVVIGTPRLSALYSQALKTREIGVRTIDGDTASLAGLTALYQDARERVSHVG